MVRDFGDVFHDFVGKGGGGRNGGSHGKSEGGEPLYRLSGLLPGIPLIGDWFRGIKIEAVYARLTVHILADLLADILHPRLVLLLVLVT